ncbi:MAG: hypothetical protein ACLP5H_32665 [Desulfomonilaceae bacterium]
MKKSAISLAFLASMTMVAYYPTIPASSEINRGQCSYDMTCRDGLNTTPTAWSHSLAEGKELRPTASSNAKMVGTFLTAARADDKGEKNGDVDGDGKKDSDKGDKNDKEKEDEGGWDRLWDAPKQG